MIYSKLIKAFDEQLHLSQEVNKLNESKNILFIYYHNKKSEEL